MQAFRARVLGSTIVAVAIALLGVAAAPRDRLFGEPHIVAQRAMWNADVAEQQARDRVRQLERELREIEKRIAVLPSHPSRPAVDHVRKRFAEMRAAAARVRRMVCACVDARCVANPLAKGCS